MYYNMHPVSDKIFKQEDRRVTYFYFSKKLRHFVRHEFYVYIMIYISIQEY